MSSGNLNYLVCTSSSERGTSSSEQGRYAGWVAPEASPFTIVIWCGPALAGFVLFKTELVINLKKTILFVTSTWNSGILGKSSRYVF
jgi:hypothetical protein